MYEDNLINKLEYLQETKDIIKQSIINKGVSVEDTDTFRSYANKIEDIHIPNIQEYKEANASKEDVLISSDEGYEAIKTVKIKAVTSSIDENIKSENIKQGVNILGVEGNYSGGGSGPTTKSNIYRVTSIEERDAITDMVDGDMCIVYYSNISNATVDSRFSSILLPATVVLPEAVTNQIYSSFRNEDRTVDVNIMLEQTTCRIDIMMEPDYTSIEYTSEDGITYTRTTDIEEVILPGEVSCHYPEEWNDAIGYFIQLGTINFDGIFTYKDNNWVYSKVGISTTPDYVYANKDFYSNTGKNTGTLALNMANTFNDISAKAYAEMQLNYDKMSVEIAPEDCTYYYFHKDNTKLYIVPTKSNGEPLLDTSNVTNMRFMFCNCPNLIAIPLLNTKNVTNMESMFDHCTNLQIVPLLDTSNVTNMNRMFWACKSIKNIPLLNISSITSMEQMFGFCTSLTTVPQFDTSNITDMGEMFDMCTSLTTVPQFNTSNVKYFNSMFRGCTSLTSVPTFDTSNATSISNMFCSCTSLTTVPQFDTSNVKYMAGVFDGCTSLTTIPQFDTSNVINMESMFDGCTSLTTIPQFDTSNVTTMNYMFRDCTGLEELDLSSFNTSKVKYMWFMFDGCTSLRRLDIRNFSFTNVTEYTKMFNNVPSDCLIIVKDSTAKSWITSKFTNLTNVKTVAEYGG